MGVRSVAVVENGRAVEVTEDRVLAGETFGAGRVHVWAGREVPKAVLRERAALAQEGAAFCFVTLDGANVDVFVTTRGVVDGEEIAAAHAASEDAVRVAVAEAPTHSTDEFLSEVARQAVRRAFKHRLGVKPVTTARIQRRGVRS
jgi:mRNA degradation ribonuclease J1/J2